MIRYDERKVMNMIYGYARVSLKVQALHGNSLEDQLMQLLSSGCSQVIE